MSNKNYPSISTFRKSAGWVLTFSGYFMNNLRHRCVFLIDKNKSLDWIQRRPLIPAKMPSLKRLVSHLVFTAETLLRYCITLHNACLMAALPRSGRALIWHSQLGRLWLAARQRCVWSLRPLFVVPAAVFHQLRGLHSRENRLLNPAQFGGNQMINFLERIPMNPFKKVYHLEPSLR